MSMAARLGDMTAHGNPLGPFPAGSMDVFIGGMPAWRGGVDLHKCPLVDASTHVGGTVAKASTTVFINNLPAVRKGDVIVEGGVSNRIESGCPTVFIG